MINYGLTFSAGSMPPPLPHGKILKKGPVLNGYVTNPNPTPTLTPNPNPNPNPNRINKKKPKKNFSKSIGRFAGWKNVLTSEDLSVRTRGRGRDKNFPVILNLRIDEFQRTMNVFEAN